MKDFFRTCFAMLLFGVAASASAQLTVTKTATDAAGNPITASSTIPAGSTINYRVAFQYTGAQYIAGSHFIDQMSPGQQVIPGSVVAPAGWTTASPNIFDATNKADFTTLPIFPNGAIGTVIQASSGITSQITSGTTGGDGLAPIIDATGGRVFTIFHHTQPATIACKNLSDGTDCSGYAGGVVMNSGTAPGAFSAETTQSGEQFIYNGRIYYSAIRLDPSDGGNCYSSNSIVCIYEAGLYCWDLTANASCPYIKLATYQQLPRQAFGLLEASVQIHKVIGNSVYANVAGQLKCVSLPAGGTCAGFVPPPNLGSINNPQSNGPGGIDLYDARYVVWTNTNLANTQIGCYDATTNSTCAGSWPLTLSGVAMQPFQLGVTGAETGFCLANDGEIAAHGTITPLCFGFNGASQSNAAIAQLGPIPTIVTRGILTIPNTNRVIYPTGANSNVCIDFTTPAGTPCLGFKNAGGVDGIRDWMQPGQNGGAAIGMVVSYGSSYYQGCAYGLGDAGVLWSYDPYTGNTPCLSGQGAISQAVPATQYCDGKPHVTGWQTLAVNGLGNGIYSATITVRDAQTNAVLVPLTFYPIFNDSISIPLSGISYTQHPQLQFDFILAGPNVAPNAPLADAVVSFTTDRQDQDICYSATAPTQCGVATPITNTASFNDVNSVPIAGSVAAANATCATPTIAIQKTANITNYNPGASTPITYTLNVTNQTPLVATNVTVSDPTPAGVTIATWSCATCSPSSGAGAVNTSIASLAGNASVPITVSATINPNATGTVVNTVTATPPTGGDCATSPCSSTTNTPPGASLALLKTVDHATYFEGSATSLNYTLQVVNSSPTAAVGVSLTDVAPPGVTFTGWACSGCSPSSGSGNVSTTFTVPGNGSQTIVVAATVATSKTGAIINTATIVPPANAFCAATGACTSSAETDPLPKLAIVKTASVQNYQPGQATAQTYTLTISNSASVAATGVAVSDAAPSNVSFGNWSAPGCSPASGTGSVSTTCAVPANGSTAITVAATITASATGAVANTATITPPPGSQCVAPSPGCTSTVTTPPAAVLSVAKTQSIATYTEGTATTIDYTLTVTNSSSTPATGVTVSDPGPAGVTLSAWAAPGCTPLAGSGSVTTACSVPANGTATITVHGTIQSTATGAITNTATVTPPSGAFCASANGCTSSVTANPVPQVSIVKTSSVANYLPGSQLPITYTLTVTNSASVPATAVQVTDVAPANVTFGNWNAPGCTPSSGTGSVSTVCTIAAKSSVAVSVSATINASATGTVSNTGTIVPPSGGQCVSPSPNCTSTVNTPAGAVLSIVKSQSIDSYREGAATPISYTLTLSNTSTSAAAGVQVSDTPPAGVTFASWSAPGCSPSSGTGAVATACSVPANGSISVAVNATIGTAATGSLVNTATAVPGSGDACASNTSCSSSVTATPIPVVSIVKTESVTHYKAGTLTPIVYTLTLTNAASVDALDALVSDSVPAGISFTGWSAPNCDPSSGVGDVATSCTIPASSTAVITVTASIASASKGTLTNTATVLPPPSGVCLNAQACTSTVTAQPIAPPADPPKAIPVLSQLGFLLFALCLIVSRYLSPSVIGRR